MLSKVTQFDSLPFVVSYCRPRVTLSLKCTVFEIWQHIGRRTKSTPLSFGTLLAMGVIPCEFFDESCLARKYM